MNLSALGYCTQDTRQEKASQDAVPRPHKNGIPRLSYSVMFCVLVCTEQTDFIDFIGPRRMPCICSFPIFMLTI